MLCQKIISDYTGLYPRPCWRCYTLKRVKPVNDRGEELRFYSGMWPSKAQPLSVMFYSLVFNFLAGFSWICHEQHWHWLHERLTKKKAYKTCTTKLWETDGHDWGTFSWPMAEFWSHMTRGGLSNEHACYVDIIYVWSPVLLYVTWVLVIKTLHFII